MNDLSAPRESRNALTDLAMRLARRGVQALLTSLSQGQLQLEDALGSVLFGPVGMGNIPPIKVHISDLSAYLDIALRGTVGAAEAYMAGKWTVSDLTGMVRLLVVNREVMNQMESGMTRFASLPLKIAHGFKANTPKGSRHNIRFHYDLGNDFFKLFLDPTMMYSSAIFATKEASLEEASLHKLNLICRKLALQSTDHLLEIGTGWGGLALYAARNFGCRVTTTTISRNQYEFATEQVRAAGLSDRITVLSEDYRDLTGTFDKLVSVEMIEAVGLRFLDSYFQVCNDRLKPSGRMLLQSIIIADRNFEQARHSVDFIQKYIFPGGALPSHRALLVSIGRVTDLQLTGLEDIGLDYARTLQLWREKFFLQVEAVHQLGYPAEFVRMWEWYLAYCEGGFLERAISAVQLVLDRPACRLAPWKQSA